MAKSKLSPVPPMPGPTDGGYQSVSSRKIENGYVVTHSGGDAGFREVYHADEPKISADGRPPREMSSSLSRAVKVARG